MKESPGTGFFPLGMVEIWVACPACTLKKITKARPRVSLYTFFTATLTGSADETQRRIWRKNEFPV